MEQSTVLVVDDSETNRILLRSILKKNGYLVKECSNGKECLDFCEKEQPGVILLDVMMPEIDGIEATKILRRKFSKQDLPIILVTAKIQGEDIAGGINAGANDYITKPIDSQVLLARLINQINLYQANKKIKEQSQTIENALRVQTIMGDALPDAIAVSDKNDAIIYQNKELKRVYAQDQCLNLPELFSQIYAGQFKETLLKMLADLRLEPKISFESEHEISTDAGLNIKFITKPIELDNGEVLRLWLWRDITQIRQLEKRINQQIKLDTVSLFATGVAHNFNNIIGSILGASDILARNLKGNKVADQCISIIQKAVRQSCDLIRRMQVLNTELEKNTCKLEEIILAIVKNIVETKASVAQGKIKINIKSEVNGLEIAISPNHLFSILDSLLCNAVESIEDQGAIEIGAKADSRQVNISIKDNGSGMSLEVISKLYQPFFSTKNMDECNGISLVGRGLGLWNVYNLVKMNHGDIEISSLEGQGTTVSLKLPLQN